MYDISVCKGAINVFLCIVPIPIQKCKKGTFFCKMLWMDSPLECTVRKEGEKINFSLLLRFLEPNQVFIIAWGEKGGKAGGGGLMLNTRPTTHS